MTCQVHCCYQRACLSGQSQANATHFPVSPSVTGENDPGIGGGTQREAGGRQGEAETVTVHAQRFQEDLSPCRTPAAGVMCMLYIRGDIPAYG